MSGENKKILIVTFGFHGRGITEPIKKMNFDVLWIVSSRKNFESQDYRDLKKSLGAIVPIEKEIEVDVFDFPEIFNTVSDIIKENMKRYEFSVCISGGTNILAGAVLLAAIVNHVRCYYTFGDHFHAIPRFPVNSITFVLEGKEYEILGILDDGQRVEEIVKGSDEDPRDILLKLDEEGFIEIVKGEDPVIHLTPKGRMYRDFIRTFRKKS